MARKQTKRTRPAELDEDETPEAEAAPVAVKTKAPEMVGKIEVGAYYVVLPERALHFTHQDRPTLWATEGQIVHADHAVLAEMLNYQNAKVRKVEGDPDESKVVPVTRADVLALLAGRQISTTDGLAIQRVGSLPKSKSGAPAID